MTIRQLILQLQAQEQAIGSDAPVVLQAEDPDDWSGQPTLSEPTLEVRALRVKGRGAPALSIRKSAFDRKGVVLL
jgi:hypothetical protein